jgi:O-antigen/teichoic acid export membrane protein
MIAATDAMVVLSVAGPAAAVVFAMTAKLGEIAMQVSWQLPDAALIGLAQLKGERRPERVREVTLSLVRLTLLGAGAVACGVLAFNPAFVTLWVGPARFGGLLLNALLAAEMMSHSLGHALFATSATLGARVHTGWMALLQGVVNLALAVVLGRAFGLAGVAAATVLSTLAVAYPAGVRMVRRTTGLTQRALWRSAFAPWLGRTAGLLLLGGVVGAASLRALWLPAALFVWTQRPLYAGLPFPERARRLLVAVRVLRPA